MLNENVNGFSSIFGSSGQGGIASTYVPYTGAIQDVDLGAVKRRINSTKRIGINKNLRRNTTIKIK